MTCLKRIHRICFRWSRDLPKNCKIPS